MWRVYYEDGSTFDSAQGRPRDAPAFGVMGIRQDPPGNPQLISRDFYLYREDYGCWIEVDSNGLVDHFTHAAPHITACLAGRTVPPAVWKAACKRMNDDGDRHN